MQRKIVCDKCVTNLSLALEKCIVPPLIDTYTIINICISRIDGVDIDDIDRRDIYTSIDRHIHLNSGSIYIADTYTTI